MSRLSTLQVLCCVKKNEEQTNVTVKNLKSNCKGKCPLRWIIIDVATVCVNTHINRIIVTYCCLMYMCLPHG